MSAAVKWWASVIAMAVTTIYLAALVFGWGIESVVRDCDNFGKFYSDGQIYECTQTEQQPTSHGAGVPDAT